MTVRRHRNGATLELLTNDLTRSAVAIGQLYKTRWQIELLFRWMKQHLRIRSFIGNNENAIRLQIIAAMIAYVLIRIAAKANCVKLPVLRLLDLVGQCLFDRRSFGAIDKPPPVNPARKRDCSSPNQMRFIHV